MSLEEQYQQEFDRVVKTVAVRYMADLIAIRIESTKEYFIIKSLRLPPNIKVPLEIFKKELVKCERPIVISDMGMKIKENARKLSKIIQDIL